MPGFIDREEVRRLVDQEGAQVAEVLPRSEYDWGHIAGAVHLPLKELSREAAAETLDASRPVILYCNNHE